MPLLPERSVTRRIDREAFILLGGTAALLMQVAHPLVAAGVDQHSDFRRDPLGRLLRTLDTTLAVVFGTDAQAARAVARINAVHARVRGASERGVPYSALDPALLLWVEATLVLTALRLYERVAGPLPAEEREAYWSESKAIAVALGIPRERLPGTLADLERYEQEMLEREVIPDETARRVGRDVLRRFRFVPAAAYWPNDAVAAALLPPSLRRAYGLRYATPERLFFRGVVVAVRGLRRIAPAWIKWVPQARRRDRSARSTLERVEPSPKGRPRSDASAR